MSPALGLVDLLGESRPQQDFPLSLPESQRLHTYNGSAAIYQYAKELQLTSADTIAVPAYMCGSEMGAFDYLDCQIVIYNVEHNLQIDTDDLRQCLDTQEVHTVLVTHYFGVAQENIAEIALLCLTHSVTLLEDCAHALYSSYANQPLGSFGDYAIFSQRKSLGITEGGSLVSNLKPLETLSKLKKAPLIPLLDRTINALIAKPATSHRTGLNGLLDKVTKLCFLPVSITVKVLRIIGQKRIATWISPEMERNEAIPIYDVGMSATMFKVFQGTVGQSVRAARQQNYRHLAQTLDDVTGVEALLPTIDDQCCPLYFPVIVDDPSALVAHLDNKGVEAYKWWQHSHERINLDQYPYIIKLKQSVVALPCHQDMTSQQIEKVAIFIKQYFQKYQGQFT